MKTRTLKSGGTSDVFERYSEEARQVIFFARYEAGNLRRPEIEPEHILLGIMRADRNHTPRRLPPCLDGEAVRARVAQERPAAENVSTSVDLPLSHESKRVLAYGAEEAARLGHPHIGVEHMLQGLLREERSLAATILRDAGLTPEQLRRIPAPPPPPPDLPAEFRDLTKAAENGKLGPLIGREAELTRTLQILARRMKNSVALIGEAGVGKTAIVEGLAQRLSSGIVPGFAETRVWVAEANSLFPPHPGRASQKSVDEMLDTVASDPNSLFCIEGLFDLATARFDWGALEAAHLLELSRGTLRCIATGTPAGLRATLEKAPVLARFFEVVPVPPTGPDEALNILRGLQSRYEEFHKVTFGAGTIEMALYASGRFLAHRSLPDRALDLLDEAGARVRLRPQPTGNTVTPDGIEQVIADRTGAQISAVKAVLAQKGPGELERIVGELAARLPLDANQWLAFLARSSDAEIDALVQAIQAAR